MATIYKHETLWGEHMSKECCLKEMARDVSSMGGVKFVDTMDAVGTSKQPESSLRKHETP